ncbi:MAG TPA: LD-carboxypeptidase, partial [Firmicutes bacterium]|nr:LD-carboxypeptidase [Bacillota bacterium]
LSNGLNEKLHPVMDELVTVLESMGLHVVIAKKLFGFLHASDQEKAEMLMAFYEDKEMAAIFDVSGGDLANGVLPYLDFQVIEQSNKPFFGYSDLSVILNGLYAKTNQQTYLYQIRNLVGLDGAQQIENFKRTFFDEKSDLFDIEVEWIQGNQLSGVAVGGNIRCFLKLAGTPYMPDFKNKV